MELALAFIGAPLATFLLLAALPRGRPAFYGIIAAVVGTAVLWLSQVAQGDNYFVALVTLVFSAVALAAFVQVLRVTIGPGRPRWVYPLIVLAALVIAGLPLLYELGF